MTALSASADLRTGSSAGSTGSQGPNAADIAALRKDEPKTAIAMWKERVRDTPQRIAFRYKKDAAWAAMTWAEADTFAREVAAGLVSLGVAPGDRIALLSQTRLEWVLCDVAILLAGAVTVPIYPQSTAEQCEFIIRDAGAKLVIVEDASQIGKLLPVRHRLFTVARLVHVSGDATLEKPDAQGRTHVTLAEVTHGAGDFVTSLDDLRAAGRVWLGKHPGELDSHSAAITPESMFTIIYTSGTTGTPKGVVLTHENISAGVCSAVRAIDILAADQQYLFVPLAHVLGREIAWAPIQSRLYHLVLRGDREDQGQPGRGAAVVHGQRAAHLREVLQRVAGRVRAGLAGQAKAGEVGLGRWQGRVVAQAGGEVAGPLARAEALHRRQAGVQQGARAPGAGQVPLPGLGRRAALAGDRRVLPRGRPADPRGLRPDRDRRRRVLQPPGQPPLRHGRSRRWTWSR